MITLSVIQSRIRRANIPEYAGDDFIQGYEVLKKIMHLKDEKGEQFLFGICQNPMKWTVLSVTNLFACNGSYPFKVSILNDADHIHDNFSKEGGKFLSDVTMPDGKVIWMKSPEMSAGFQNILLLLQRLPKGSILED